MGKNCRSLIDYFENIPGAVPLPKDYNPVMWMLEYIGAGVSNSAADDMEFVLIFSTSSYKQQLDTNLSKEAITTPSPDYPEINFSNKLAASSMTQMKFVVGHFVRMPEFRCMVFMASLFNAMVSLRNVVPLACEEWVSFYRERVGQIYNAFW
ncbi:Pleiotropic drug resistance protein ABC Superfamily [Phytophthora cinnamomi]|uniref:Pleiotropic drug resistance protein ABC Superfamily n=1 Tax=Phytophthora cinnamomi TaxID=4785 RepID=UPI0035595C40|nr:Pleiotropic drug resistance protein ABC Superfamily [Phytophthora cinnamomi]